MHPLPSPARARGSTWRGALLAAALLQAACSGAPRPTERTPALRPGQLAPDDKVMRVHFIDVGQGDAILFEFPCGAMLLDTGGERNAAFDGMKALRRYLYRFFKRRKDLNNTLDLLAITHPHMDHTLGIKEVIFAGSRPRFRIRNVITNGQVSSPGGPAQGMLQAWARAQRSVGFRMIVTDDIPPGQPLTDEVIDPIACPGVDPRILALWGRVTRDPGWGHTPWGTRFDNENNHSIVLRVDFGESSVIASGDLEQVALHDMMMLHRGNRVLDADIYKVGHHGSYNATRRDFLRVVTPEIAVLSVGPADREVEWSAWMYGHPREVTVRMLQRDVSGHRAPVMAPVGTRMKTFFDMRVDRAIYATGWDGTVVVEADAAGNKRVFTQRRE